VSDKVAVPQVKLEALLEEKRIFPPSDEFRRQANVADVGCYERAERDLEGFWAEEAARLECVGPGNRRLDWNRLWA
jgi:acetyl-CoA synthetase